MTLAPVNFERGEAIIRMGADAGLSQAEEKGMRSERILITGGAGFIGSELTGQLAAQGAHIVVVDNLVNGKRENLEGVLSDQVHLEVADIRDVKTMTELLEGVDIVFHLACLGVRHSIHSPIENHEVNATGTLHLLKACRNVNVGRFVYVSTSEVYGTARWVPMTEEHPTFPMTVYGASKLAGDCYTRAFHRTYDYPTVVVRPFNTYGPRCHHEGDSGEVIPKFMLRCLAGKPMVVFGDGRQTRDFTYVSDMAKGIIAAGMADESIGQTLNLGSGGEIAVKELAGKIAGVVGKKEAGIVYDSPRPGDVLRLYADTGKAKDLIFHQPDVTLEKGLEKLKDWYLQKDISIEALLEQEQVRSWERGADRTR